MTPYFRSYRLRFSTHWSSFLSETFLLRRLLTFPIQFLLHKLFYNVKFPVFVRDIQ